MAERSAFTTLNQDTATVSSKEEIVQKITSVSYTHLVCIWKKAFAYAEDKNAYEKKRFILTLE